MVPSREKARGLIMAGNVTVEGSVVTKAGHMVGDGAVIEVGGVMPFVGRGGLKLDAALEFFGVDVREKVAMDVGASTGGFTDCLLQRGAKKVYAIDVGYGLIDYKLRSDPRVVLVERTNFRYIDRETVPGCIDIAALDVSFISVSKIFPRLVEFLCDGGEVLALVKPQFEVGKGLVGKGGVVRDERRRKEALDSVIRRLPSFGLAFLGVFESPVRGRKGNIEYFLYGRKV